MSSEKTDKPDVPADTTTPATSSKPLSSTGEESPRTAREPDFDDDVPEAHLSAPVAPAAVPERQSTPASGRTPKRVSFQDDVVDDSSSRRNAGGPAPPPKPPRPLSPNAQAEATLKEAFPSIDAGVVEAVLVASGGNVEPAFNALLSMSDPSSQEQAPAPPPRNPRQVSQLEADEIYARQLAEQYNSSTHDGFGSRTRREPTLPRQQRQTNLKPNELYDDREHSFFDDDLPVIKENLQKGFEDTKNTINKWIKDFQKKIDGDDSDDPIPRPGGSQQQRQNFGPSQSAQLHGIQRQAAQPRRSGDRDRYDADPQVLSDDFGHRLELRDEEAPPRSQRPLANPNLFRGTAGEPQESGTTGLGASSSSGGINRVPSPAGAGKGKWQPLSSVEPKPELEDHDPFSLGDSDEELETKGTSSGAAAAAKTDGGVKDAAIVGGSSTKTEGVEKAEEVKTEKK